jgi:hypothetical protein
MSALPPEADIGHSDWHVRFVPQGHVRFVPQADISLLLLPATQPDRIHPFDDSASSPSGMVTMPRIPIADRRAI